MEKAAAPCGSSGNFSVMTTAEAPAAPVKASPFFEETVLWVKHWTDRLFSFAITRPERFRFRSGEFAMFGRARSYGTEVTFVKRGPQFVQLMNG